jgi:hypothetical protein
VGVVWDDGKRTEKVCIILVKVVQERFFNASSCKVMLNGGKKVTGENFEHLPWREI